MFLNAEVSLLKFQQGDFCDSDGIRTHDPRLRRALLYPAELRNHFVLYSTVGIVKRHPVT